ncbi:unnamed protein product [marine sediment metagenome]|uniref:Uncharacterized protein n=1 Tax=marine sediment metagenome TaxID=412755 RepID=X0UH28_9ZZZZ
MKIPKKQIAKILKAVTTDTLFVIGLAGISFGLWEIYHPTAYIFLGSFIIYMVLPSKKAKNTEKGQ